jgi:hypothetical protein
MREVGQDSTYRFPSGCEDWTSREVIGTIEVRGGEKREVAVIYPEIHDLIVAKLAIGREKDLDFLQGVIDLGLVDLKERYREAPRTGEDRIVDGLAQIDEAFERRVHGAVDAQAPRLSRRQGD